MCVFMMHIAGIIQKKSEQFPDIYVKDFYEIKSCQVFQRKKQQLHRLSERKIRKCKMKTVLTIAGSDASGGGAGIQADIKTLTVHKVYATSCITALTAQNTKGITGIMPVPSDFFEKQMDSVFSDIKPDAVKIGMIASKEQVELYCKVFAKIFNKAGSSRSGYDFNERNGSCRRESKRSII